jgi:hypothetical protein
MPLRLGGAQWVAEVQRSAVAAEAQWSAVFAQARRSATMCGRGERTEPMRRPVRQTRLRRARGAVLWLYGRRMGSVCSPATAFSG